MKQNFFSPPDKQQGQMTRYNDKNDEVTMTKSSDEEITISRHGYNFTVARESYCILSRDMPDFIDKVASKDQEDIREEDIHVYSYEIVDITPSATNDSPEGTVAIIGKNLKTGDKRQFTLEDVAMCVYGLDSAVLFSKLIKESLDTEETLQDSAVTVELTPNRTHVADEDSTEGPADSNSSNNDKSDLVGESVVSRPSDGPAIIPTDEELEKFFEHMKYYVRDEYDLGAFTSLDVDGEVPDYIYRMEDAIARIKHMDRVLREGTANNENLVNTHLRNAMKKLLVMLTLRIMEYHKQ